MGNPRIYTAGPEMQSGKMAEYTSNPTLVLEQRTRDDLTMLGMRRQTSRIDWLRKREHARP